VVERKKRQISDREKKIKGEIKAGFGEIETYTDSEEEIKEPW
jgi:hypothetical protein